ncbi:MAG: hypothetical protein HY940_06885 [Gammaproteobacteria bacterium]|nr:hypothetical protein [Gammaproteobacteria bacterium]
MKETLLYSIAAITALFILGYSVHMIAGGLVSPATERLLITLTCLVGAAVIALMAWDVIRRRRNGT